MDLSDALGEGGVWPGGGSNPPAGGAVWPGGATNPTWPGGVPGPARLARTGGTPEPGPAHLARTGGTPEPGPAHLARTGGTPGPAHLARTGGTPEPGPAHLARTGGTPEPGPAHLARWSGGPGPAHLARTRRSRGAQTPAQPTWPGQGGPTPPAQSVSMNVPFDQKLPNGVFDKLLITVKGTVKPHANTFTINIKSSHDLAFHFNVRFNEGGHKVIVRNSEISKKWGKEERGGAFPFVQGQPFEMKVLCTSAAYRVAVNGSHLLEYQHRVKDLRSINLLSIYKDVTLTSVLVDRLP
ncbi:unnamed protein product [Gadus morhua 'NCC']